MLQADSLVVRYGAVHAVRDVSLRLSPGEVVGLVGLNGAGKSSTLHALAGAVRMRRGSVCVDGETINRARARPEALVQRGLSLVPESRRIFTTLTVEENLRLGGVSRRKRADLRNQIAHWYERFPDLGRFRDHRAGDLSGGQQQQLAIARSLMTKPRYLLLDEPSLGLAPGVVASVWELIGELRQQGTGVLLVDQLIQPVLDIADRCYVISKGVITADGTGDQVLPALEQAGMALAIGQGFS